MVPHGRAGRGHRRDVPAGLAAGAAARAPAGGSERILSAGGRSGRPAGAGLPWPSSGERGRPACRCGGRGAVVCARGRAGLSARAVPSGLDVSTGTGMPEEPCAGGGLLSAGRTGRQRQRTEQSGRALPHRHRAAGQRGGGLGDRPVLRGGGIPAPQRPHGAGALSEERGAWRGRGHVSARGLLRRGPAGGEKPETGAALVPPGGTGPPGCAD